MLHCAKHNGIQACKRFQFAIGQIVCLVENLVMSRIISSVLITISCPSCSRQLLNRRICIFIHHLTLESNSFNVYIYGSLSTNLQSAGHLINGRLQVCSNIRM